MPPSVAFSDGDSNLQPNLTLILNLTLLIIFCPQRGEESQTPAHQWPHKTSRLHAETMATRAGPGGAQSTYLCGCRDVLGDAPKACGAALHRQAVAAAGGRTGWRRPGRRTETQQEDGEQAEQQNSHHAARDAPEQEEKPEQPRQLSGSPSMIVEHVLSRGRTTPAVLCVRACVL